MSTDTDRLGERVAGIEGTVGQMNERLGTIENRIGGVENRLDGVETRMDRLDGKVNQVRRDIRQWLVLVVLATSLLTSIVFGVMQVLL